VTFADTLPLIWPLAFVLVALFVLRKIEAQINPIIVNVVGGVATNAKQYALMYAMAFIYASAASLQALGEVATGFGWIHIAAFAKVAQPGIVAIIAYVTKPPQFTQANADVKTPTNPPFPPAAPKTTP
jgi:hypothetical protein